MSNYIKTKYVILDSDISSKEEAFKIVSQIAIESKLLDSAEDLIKAFEERENLDSTAFDGGFAIPHARSKSVKDTGIFFIRFKNPIKWDVTNKETKCAIFLVIPEGQGDYLDVLSGVATKLLDEKVVDVLKNTKDSNEVINVLSSKQEVLESNGSKNSIKVVGVSACPTGVAHTYMARTALLKAGEQLGWNVKIETQGQKGQEFPLTDKEIEDADVVFLAIDITVDKDRFVGKKIYQVGTKKTLRFAEEELKKSLNEAQLFTSGNSNIGEKFETKGPKQSWVQHLMAGISYMIPFIVFAGLTSAIIAGAANAADVTLSKDNTGFWKFAWQLNEFANIGFSVMFAIAGAYIANSIAGRAAIAPAFILTMIGNRPDLVWQGYFQDIMVNQYDEATGTWVDMSINGVMQPLNVFGAVIFGLSVGYTVKHINTKWKINQYIQPIMPIIIIPVFLTLIFGVFWMFTFGPLIGIAIGYLYTGIVDLENAGVGMILVGLILGLLSGVDMGGPINKIASFGATAMIPIDGGLAMGCSAAAFAVAPLGAGLSTIIFKTKFKDDKEMGINATILGFMGVSESAIPFAIKYKWAAIVPNIICSGIAGMVAGIFMVQGHVGAWGGPIIAVFAGVTDNSGNFIGILWYLIAIAIGTACHIVLFRILVEVQSKGKLTGSDIKSLFKKNKKETNKEFVEKL